MFSSVVRFFKGLFSKKTIKAIDNALEAAAPYVAAAIPVVETIIALTPTRSDDEILAVVKHFGLLNLFDMGSDRGTILRDVAVEVVREKVKDRVPTSLLNTSIELAYQAVKRG